MTRPFAFRDERGNIRLDELLGEEHVRHYTRILSSSSEEFSAMQLAMSLAEIQDGTAAPGERRDESPAAGETEDGYITRRGLGLPSRASSCRDLEPVPSWCWDVCGYYLRLGVSWRATTRELRIAYLSRDPRQENEPLHYALTQLLDPDLRRAYDRMPPGSAFMADRDIQAAFQRAAARESARRMAADPNGHNARADVLRDMGFDDVPPEEARRRATAPGAVPPGDGGSLRLVPSWKSSWGYYVLITPDYDERRAPGGEEMEAWQAMVAAALARRGIRTRFAVGATAGTEPVTLPSGNETCIFFLGGKPSRRKADHAVRLGISRGYIRH